MSTSLPWQQRSVPVGDATIEAEALGEPDRPTLLLIGAATWSRDWWPDGFCEQLVEAGVRVIRYDARDTGSSTTYPPGEPGYDADRLVSDALAVLDDFDADRAVVVGLSMGGGTAQLLASGHRERVSGLVLMSTSPATPTGHDLPGPTHAVMATFAAPVDDPDWSDRKAVVDWIVETEQPYAGPDCFDEPALRELAGRVWDRTPSMASAANHLVVAESTTSTADVTMLQSVPALVVHGSADPLFPLAHGQALADVLGAPLLVLEGVGHQAPPPHTWDTIVRAVMTHAV